MKILYVSCHSILEYDEVKLLTELGYDVFSIGEYSNPEGKSSGRRPAINGLKFYPEFQQAALDYIHSADDTKKDIITQELIDWSDVIIFMHQSKAIQKNWENIKHKRVVFRAIGQNQGHDELLLQELVAGGLEIVRYSPREAKTVHYAGQSALIRFYKDHHEFTNWTGTKHEVIAMSAAIKTRGKFCYYEDVQRVLEGFPHHIYGSSNENLGEQWGGLLTDEQLRDVLRENRCFVYAGTYPACYTLGFMEAMMTGIPIVALGDGIIKNQFPGPDYYEIPDIITNGVDGFYANDVQSLKETIQHLLDDHAYAQSISDKARAKAIELFGKEKIAQQWKAFLG